MTLDVIALAISCMALLLGPAIFLSARAWEAFETRPCRNCRTHAKKVLELEREVKAGAFELECEKQRSKRLVHDFLAKKGREMQEAAIDPGKRAFHADAPYDRVVLP